MDRRTLLRATVGLAGGMSLAGCAGLFSVEQGFSEPPVVEDRPAAVYYPSHTEGMEMVGTSTADGTKMDGMKTNGSGNTSGMAGNASGGGAGGGMEMSGSNGSDTTSDYAFALMYSYPHRFWTVNGTQVKKVPIKPDDSLHLMATVWEPRTGIVLPDTGLSVELTEGTGEKTGPLVSEEVIYPMLSQQMGFHYGANFALPGDGRYTATLSVGAMDTRHTGAFAGRFDEPESVDIGFEYDQRRLNEIEYTMLDARKGTRGAVEPMAMEMLPSSVLPTRGDLPGTVLGRRQSGDGRFLLTVLDTPPRGIDASGPYLAVSARTPYSRMVLPSMALSGTLRRGSRTVFDGPLERTLDPALDYHYGAVVESVNGGDRFVIRVETPPQVARHEGYETAFIDMPPIGFSV